MVDRKIEILVGMFVALGLGALFLLAMQVSNLSQIQEHGTYRVTAYFDNIGGLKVRAPVTASGVRVGRVAEIGYDRSTFRARVVLALGTQYDFFPVDTSASIYTAGLLGEQYIALDPGAEEETLKDGSVIQYTQSAMILEQLIGRFLVELTSKK
ncbi:MAG TPA: outer membrane lipid asymmetry maintenance protein MlaD [Chromatiales bacterium]|nr:outer membrane lipid asymmetry maintenance protein MlaD [Chromatiales bacterium]